MVTWLNKKKLWYSTEVYEGTLNYQTLLNPTKFDVIAHRKQTAQYSNKQKKSTFL